MSITSPTDKERVLRDHGLARAVAVKQLKPQLKREPLFALEPTGEVEVFLTGFTYYLTAEEARSVALLLLNAAAEANPIGL